MNSICVRVILCRKCQISTISLSESHLFTVLYKKKNKNKKKNKKKEKEEEEKKKKKKEKKEEDEEEKATLVDGNRLHIMKYLIQHTIFSTT